MPLLIIMREIKTNDLMGINGIGNHQQKARQTHLILKWSYTHDSFIPFIFSFFFLYILLFRSIIVTVS